MSEELKPCPFCGSENCETRTVFYTVKLSRNWVTCHICGAHGPVEPTKKQAQQSWNRRAEVKGDGTAY